MLVPVAAFSVLPYCYLYPVVATSLKGLKRAEPRDLLHFEGWLDSKLDALRALALDPSLGKQWPELCNFTAAARELRVAAVFTYPVWTSAFIDVAQPTCFEGWFQSGTNRAGPSHFGTSRKATMLFSLVTFLSNLSSVVLPYCYFHQDVRGTPTL